MIEPMSLLLRGGHVEVPFEIWIILVICSGGLYLIVALIRNGNSARERSQTAPDLTPLFREVANAILSDDNEEEVLGRIWTKFGIDAGARSSIVIVVKVAMSEIFNEQQVDEGTVQKIRAGLVDKGISRPVAEQAIRSVVDVLVEKSRSGTEAERPANAE
jgi:hypothetical protein